jgi:hypothetical protein
MKIVIVFLYAFILCFLDLCDELEDDGCRSLSSLGDGIPAEFNCNIYANVVDWEGKKCDEAFGVEFYKLHCDGGASNTMGYGYLGCSEYEAAFYLNKVGIGYYTITVKSPDDVVRFELKDNSSNVLYEYALDGAEIGKITNFGRDAKGIVVTFEMPDYFAGARPSSN